MRKVELYIGYTDNTWDTVEVEVPDDTREEDIEEMAINELDTELYQSAAFVGLYYYESLEGDEPEGYDSDDPDDEDEDDGKGFEFDDDFIGDQDAYGGYPDESRDDLP